MKIIYDNILNAKEDIIAHQTNCKGVMGSGVAKFIKEKYPEVYKEYKRYCDVEDNTDLLGTMQICKCDDNKFVANLFGQYSYGCRTKQTNYEALEESLKSLYNYAKENKLSVAIPYRIGCGLGGGDWEFVESLINNIFKDYPVTFYKYGG